MSNEKELDLIKSAKELAPDAFGSTQEIEAATRLVQAVYADTKPGAAKSVEANLRQAAGTAKDASSDDGNAAITAATLLTRAALADNQNKPEQAVAYLEQAEKAATKASSSEGTAQILTATLIARSLHEDEHGDQAKAPAYLKAAEAMSQFAVSPDGKAQIQAEALIARAGLAEKHGNDQAAQAFFDKAGQLAIDLKSNDQGTADGAALINTALFTARGGFASRHGADAENYYKQADEAAKSGITADVRGSAQAQVLLSRVLASEPGQMQVGSTLLLTGLTSLRPNLEILLQSMKPDNRQERRALDDKMAAAAKPVF